MSKLDPQKTIEQIREELSKLGEYKIDNVFNDKQLEVRTNGYPDMFTGTLIRWITDIGFSIRHVFYEEGELVIRFNYPD